MHGKEFLDNAGYRGFLKFTAIKVNWLYASLYVVLLNVKVTDTKNFNLVTKWNVLNKWIIHLALQPFRHTFTKCGWSSPLMVDYYSSEWEIDHVRQQPPLVVNALKYSICSAWNCSAWL